MRFYTFEQDGNALITDYDENNVPFNLFDLYKKSVIYNGGIVNSIHYVNDNACRIDSVCNSLYGGTAYAEELLVTNNIINPFSIEDDDIIEYPDDPSKFANMYVSDNTTDENSDIKYNILKTNSNKVPIVREIPPSVNPGLNQIDIDYTKKKITVINKFK